MTALKRSERLIDTPQSVTALSGADLAKLNATQFSDFASSVPGLQFTTQGAGKSSISLRGVTAGQDVSQTVGIYVDEVPYGSSSAFTRGAQLALDVGLFDLDRIEVLRGPQGTLYGASSMGGVLKYVTNKPVLDGFEGRIQGGVSDTEDGGVNYNGAAVVNVPLVQDKVALRASGFYSWNGGYVDNVQTGQNDVDRGKIYGGRLDLLIKPVDNLSIRLTGFAQDVRRENALYSLYTLAGNPVDGTLDQRHPLAEPFRSNFRLVSGERDYDFGAAALTSVTSYQTGSARYVLDASSVYPLLLGGLVPGIAATQASFDIRTRKFTQEVRLASKPGTVEWLVGAFYTREISSNAQAVDALDANLALIPVDLAHVNLPSVYREYAFFGDLTWHLTDKFDMTGGVRYARNDQTFEQDATGLLVGPAPAAKSGAGVVTYLANARYRFSHNVTTYARFATGYRAGGPNFIAKDPVTGALLAPNSFKPDFLNSYEVGLKAETADRTFGIDGALFYIDWKDIQLPTAAGGVSVLTNASNARVKGAEVTLTARPDRGTTITGAFTYNDGYVTEDTPAIGARRGERLPNVPHFTASINADYVLNSSSLKPSVGASLRYVSDRTSSFDLNPGFPQYHLPDYVTVDLRAGFSAGPVDARLFVRNLFDVRGQLSADTTLSFLGGPAQVTILQPRTIGLSLSTRF
ncbi:MAG: TonB-dependent receptor [Sphingomonas sp.]|uniref:TonB-dependent receptor n=1 Tax=Sphingomonas sp. TaxID=28214 RepID=UPI003F809B27